MTAQDLLDARCFSERIMPLAAASHFTSSCASGVRRDTPKLCVAECMRCAVYFVHRASSITVCIVTLTTAICRVGMMGADRFTVTSPQMTHASFWLGHHMCRMCMAKSLAGLLSAMHMRLLPMSMSLSPSLLHVHMRAFAYLRVCVYACMAQSSFKCLHRKNN